MCHAVDHINNNRISEWLFKGEVTVCKYATGHARVICSQKQIELDNLFRGKMSVEWMYLQEQYMRNQGTDKAGYVWGAAIVEYFLNNMVEVLETRNEDVHGKTKTEKQHKRKQKLLGGCSLGFAVFDVRGCS